MNDEWWMMNDGLESNGDAFCIWISCPDEVDENDEDEDDEDEEEHDEKFEEEEEEEEEAISGEEPIGYNPNSTSSSATPAVLDNHLRQSSSRSTSQSHSHLHRGKSNLHSSSSSSRESSSEVDHPLTREELCICERYDQLKYRFARAHYVLLFISVDSVSVISRGIPTVFLTQLCQR